MLLGLKKRGFGQGKYVGFGGKIEPGETLIDATLRELHEESGLVADARHLEHFGRVDFCFPAKPSWDVSVEVFLVREWQGEPCESAEMIPQWFAFADIPYDQMWADARHWLLRALTGERMNLEFTYNDDNRTLTIDSDANRRS